MKRNNYFVGRIACLMALFMCLGTPRSLAQDFPEHGFISDIYVDSKSLATQSVDVVKKGYTLDKDVDVDLNKGVTGADYVYVGYKRTNNPLEAITDIIVVYCTDGSYSGENKKTVRYKGRTYYPAKYGSDSKGGNLNRGKSGSPDLYFYYTKDRSAAGIIKGDEVVTKLSVQYDSDSKKDDSYAKMWYSEDNVQPNADLNKGAGGKFIYLSMDKHVHKPYKEKGGVAGAWECGCGFALDETDAPSKSDDGYYNINSYAQFLWFCDFVNGVNKDGKDATRDERMSASARLQANIDLAEAEKAYGHNRFRPIGSGSDFGTSDDVLRWCGTLDGCYHVIKNLTLDDTVLDDLKVAGLVGYAGENCTVKDVTLENVMFKITSSYLPRYVAGVIAYAMHDNIVVDRCTVSGTIMQSENSSGPCFAAGIANIDTESDMRRIMNIQNCTNLASVKGRWASGILGCNGAKHNVRISNCINHGTIESTSSMAAVAFANASVISICNCLNTGELISTGGGCLCYHCNELSHTLSLTSCSPSSSNESIENMSANYMLDRNVTQEQLRSGEICYLLNNSQSAEDQVVWYQTLGTDGYPHPAKGGDIVYHYINCGGQQAYTNYGMFAEDMGHIKCELDYVFEYEIGEGVIEYKPGTGDDKVWFAYPQCKNCHKIYWGAIDIDLKSRRTVLEPSCWHDGMVELRYVDPDVPRDYIVYMPKERYFRHYITEGKGYTFCDNCCELLSFDEEVYLSDKVKDGVFEISNVYDLLVYNALHSGEPSPYFSGYDAKLMCDIKMDVPYQWKPMYLLGHTFDGNGHTISGFYCGGENAGFFNLMEYSTIKNLTLEGTVHAEQGALLCVNSNYGTLIENCTTKGIVYNKDGAAGICLTADGTKIVGCRNDAEVRSTKGIAGGIVASTMMGGNVNTISRTANYGHIFGQTAAGLIADIDGFYLVSNCANYGTIEGYRKVGGLFGEVAFIGDDASDRDARFCISVGETRLLAESNYKGAVVGVVNIPSTEKAQQMDVYYNHSQVGIGYVESGMAPQSNITKTSDETFATGEICIRLNEANNLYSKESEHIDGRPIWGQKIGVDKYPSLFSDNEILYKVEANNTELFVYENQMLSELTLQDKCYFHSPTTFYVKDITYDRSDVKIKKDFYATLYLPFAFQDPDIKVMEFDHYEALTGDVYLNEVDQANIEADKPYLIRLSDDCNLTEKPLVIKAQNAKISPSHDMFPRDYDDIEMLTTGFYGTYAQKSVWSEANFYCISTKYGDFRKARSDEDEGTTVSPFRSVFKLDGGAAAPAKVSINMFDNAGIETGIRDYHFVENGRGPIYNLNGQSVGESRGSLKPGIYVQNGKKVIIK